MFTPPTEPHKVATYVGFPWQCLCDRTQYVQSVSGFAIYVSPCKTRAPQGEIKRGVSSGGEGDFLLCPKVYLLHRPAPFFCCRYNLALK